MLLRNCELQQRNQSCQAEFPAGARMIGAGEAGFIRPSGLSAIPRIPALDGDFAHFSPVWPVVCRSW